MVLRYDRSEAALRHLDTHWASVILMAELIDNMLHVIRCFGLEGALSGYSAGGEKFFHRFLPTSLPVLGSRSITAIAANAAFLALSGFFA